MHPDLPKLLDVQLKDQRLAELDGQSAEIATERAALDVALERSRSEVASAERAVQEVSTRGRDAEQKLETQRAQHEKRRQRLEQERNPRVAAQLMADVELGRSILSQEEAEWARLGDEVIARQKVADEAKARLAAAEAAQNIARSAIADRQKVLDGELGPARAERETAASQLDKLLRVRYDRLRKSRNTNILVPASGGTCTACYTAIPRSRLGKLQSEGLLIEGCEMCGAIIYVATPA